MNKSLTFITHSNLSSFKRAPVLFSSVHTSVVVKMHFKGQLISEQIHAVLNFPKMQRNTARISALASKMGQINKKYHPN
jgi:hypothetical protein